ncbi:hypothetical protein AB0C12_01655 [Actinoplanes sp. NPDC048967]
MSQLPAAAASLGRGVQKRTMLLDLMVDGAHLDAEETFDHSLRADPGRRS